MKPKIGTDKKNHLYHFFGSGTDEFQVVQMASVPMQKNKCLFLAIFLHRAAVGTDVGTDERNSIFADI